MELPTSDQIIPSTPVASTTPPLGLDAKSQEDGIHQPIPEIPDNEFQTRGHVLTCTVRNEAAVLGLDAEFQVFQVDGIHQPIPESPCSDNDVASQVIGFMNPDIYRAAKEGSLFQGNTEQSLSHQMTPAKRTVLHIAAAEGHNDLVAEILRQCPNLLVKMDDARNSALHLAASEGHVAVVRTLLGFFGEETTQYMVSRNQRGDTALEEALRKGRIEVASLLVEEIIRRGEISDAGSWLYVAAAAGNLEFLNKFWVAPISVFVDRGESVVHGVLKSKNYNEGVLEFLFRKKPRLFDSVDEEGRTPLSFAAYAGNSSAVRYLLQKFPEQAHRADGKDGFFPIHTAASRGHEEIVRQLLQQFPDSWELLTLGKRRNIIHVAAMHGKATVLKCVMGLGGNEFAKHVNQRDKKGNTPLHLATARGRPKVVSILTWHKSVDVNATNAEGRTALDLSYQNSGASLSFRKRLTWAALKSAGATIRKSEYTNNILDHSCAPFKERVNTLVVVATLIATVSFACGFTLPGGTDAPSGIANLVHKGMFDTFLIFNIIAMFSSLIAVILLIAAHLDDVALLNTAFKIALPLLGVALAAMSLAFTAGVFLVVRHLTWLSVVVLAVGSFFTLFVVLLYLQLCLSLSSSNLILRYVSYPTFCFMIWATRSDIDD